MDSRHAAPQLTQLLRVRMFHFPPSGRAGVEAGWCPAMHRFKLQLCMEIISLNLVDKILTSTCTCIHLPLRLTNPLRVWKLHSPPLGEAGARTGWYTTHMLVQIDSGVRYLWAFFIQIENYTEHWPLHVRAPTCPHAQPIPWECGSSTFLPRERPVLRQAGTQPCSVQSISLHTVYKYHVYIRHENNIFLPGCEMRNVQ